jgi:MarR family 2-MHQ and catechol resistance regulon transcriptional repressor
MRTTEKYGPKKNAALSMWVKLARAYSTFGKKSNESIRSFGLTEPQFGVLETLGHLGSMTIGQLCKKQLVSGGNMTLVVDNLERDDYVRRVHSSEDRRTIIVELTEKGQKLFEDVFPKHAEDIEKFASVLTDEEIESLSALLKKLGKALA